MRNLLFALLALGLGACETLSPIGGPGPSDNFAAGAQNATLMSRSDRTALAQAFTRAMGSGEGAAWSGSRAAGFVEPQHYELANLKPDPTARIAAARGDLDITHVMETELGLHVLTRNSNIRLGPGTEHKILEVLPSGTGVDVVGRVVDRPWMLVAVDGIIRGYIASKLVIKAPGTELELAGGPRKRPVLCRAFAQRMSLSGLREEWTGSACRDGEAWRLAAPERAEEAAGVDLLGL